MKKLKKLELNEAFLSDEELKQLKGGERKNSNEVEECKCTYYDGTRLTNSNSTKGCSCQCVY